MAVKSAVFGHSVQYYVLLLLKMNSIKITRKARLTGHKGSVYALALLPQGIVSAGSDKMVALWEPGQEEEGTLLAHAGHVVYSLFHDAESSRLFAGQSAGGIHVIDLNQKKEVRLLQYHESAVFSMAVSPRHGLFFSGDAHGTVHVSRANDLSPLARFHAGKGKVRAMLVDEERDRLIIGTGEGTIHAVSLPDLNPIHAFAAHQEGFSVNALCMLNGSGLMLSGSRDAHLNSYDSKNQFALLQSIPAHNYAIYAIALHPNGKIFATASRDKTVKIWDAETLEVLARIDKEQYEGHTASVNVLAWDNDGRLITAGDDRMVMVWEVESRM
jgi:WD40 repeat protein